MNDSIELGIKIALGCLKAVPFCLILLAVLRSNRKRIKSPVLRKIIQKIFPNIFDEGRVKLFLTAFMCAIDLFILSLFIIAMASLLDSVKARVFPEIYDAVVKEADSEPGYKGSWNYYLVVEVQDENHTSAKIYTSDKVVKSIPKVYGKVEEEIKIQVCHGLCFYYIKDILSVNVIARILNAILMGFLFFRFTEDLPVTEDDMDIKEKKLDSENLNKDVKDEKDDIGKINE